MSVFANRDSKSSKLRDFLARKDDAKEWTVRSRSGSSDPRPSKAGDAAAHGDRDNHGDEGGGRRGAHDEKGLFRFDATSPMLKSHASLVTHKRQSVNNSNNRILIYQSCIRPIFCKYRLGNGKALICQLAKSLKEMRPLMTEKGRGLRD